MIRRTYQNAILPAVACIVAAGLFTGCGGGGGGGGGSGGTSNALGVIVAVSFTGYAPSPSPGGPNAAVPLPSVFLDEVLQFTFDGPIDDGILGGFYSVAGTPVEYIGISSNPNEGVPYYAYASQSVARTSLEIRENTAAAPLLGAYIVGRHRDKPNTIVIDPKVPLSNPFGLTFNTGFTAATEYVYRIPANTSLTVGNTRVQTVDPGLFAYPLVLNPGNPGSPPPFNPQAAISQVFRSGTSTGPDPVPPQVLSIEAQSGAVGSGTNPILAGDPIVVTFSKSIDPATINPLANFTVRNVSLGNSFVPGNIVVNPGQGNVAVFTPTPGYGPGPYSIEVRVGSFANTNIPPIKGLPQGAQSTQLDLSNSLSRSFQSESCSTCVGATTVIERFDTTQQRDSTFTPVMNPAGWAVTGPGGQPGFLCGVPISGNPLGTFLGVSLGTRVQRLINTTFPGTIGGTVNPPGLFSPFDDAGTNNLGAQVNPTGGSHIMHLYEAVDLGSLRDSLELIEWGALQSFVNQTTYPNYFAWCGITTLTAPISCPAGVLGLSTVYSQNYTNTNGLQANDPLNPTTPPACPFPNTPPALGGVRVTGPIPYNAGPGFTTYYPFPLFRPPYDYLGTGANAGNLVFEQNISPGTQLVNFNRYRASAVNPVRRLIGAPKTLTANCNAGPPLASFGGCEIYDMRFTFVGIVSSSRSNFYDTNLASPVYLNFSLSPSPQNQPPGSFANWELEGANGISSPSTPSGGSTGFLSYWNGTPETGTFNPAVLTDNAPTGIAGRRYFRFRATFRNEPNANGRQCYNSFIMAIQF